MALRHFALRQSAETESKTSRLESRLAARSGGSTLIAGPTSERVSHE
jgi:hypothetical protein